MISFEAVWALGITLLWLLPTLALYIHKRNTDKWYRAQPAGPVYNDAISLVENVSVPLATLYSAVAALVYPVLLLGGLAAVVWLMAPFVTGGASVVRLATGPVLSIALLFGVWRLFLLTRHQAAVLLLALKVLGRELQVTPEGLSASIGLLDAPTQRTLVRQARSHLTIPWHDISDFAVMPGGSGMPHFRVMCASGRARVGIMRYRIQDERRLLLCARQYLKCRVRVRDKLR